MRRRWRRPAPLPGVITGGPVQLAHLAQVAQQVSLRNKARQHGLRIARVHAGGDGAMPWQRLPPARGHHHKTQAQTGQRVLENVPTYSTLPPDPGRLH